MYTVHVQKLKYFMLIFIPAYYTNVSLCTKLAHESNTVVTFLFPESHLI